MSEEKLVVDDGDMDAFFAEMEAINRGPWLKRVWYYRGYYIRLPYRWPRERWRELLAFFERGKKGWAVEDTWDMDRYLARVIAQMTKHLSEHNHGCSPKFFDETKDNPCEVWEARLRELSAAFAAYNDFLDSPDKWQLDMGNIQYDKLIERMRPLFDDYSCLND